MFGNSFALDVAAEPVEVTPRKRPWILKTTGRVAITGATIGLALGLLALAPHAGAAHAAAVAGPHNCQIFYHTIICD